MRGTKATRSFNLIEAVLIYSSDGMDLVPAT